MSPEQELVRGMNFPLPTENSATLEKELNSKMTNESGLSLMNQTLDDSDLGGGTEPIMMACFLLPSFRQTPEASRGSRAIAACMVSRK